MLDTRNILIYGGVFDLDSIEMLLYQAKKRMDIHGANISVKKKLFNIIVECLDNIQKHTDALNNTINHNSRIKQSVDHSFFSFDFNEEYYVIKTKNVIQNEHIENLKHKVDSINKFGFGYSQKLPTKISFKKLFKNKISFTKWILKLQMFRPLLILKL